MPYFSSSRLAVTETEQLQCTLSPHGDGSGRAMMLGNFQCRGVLLTGIEAEQGSTPLAVGADGGWI